MKKKRIIFTALGLCAALAVLWLLQALLMPKYMEDIQEGAMIGEYYAEAGDNDVIFIGNCEVYENFSPITLWEEYGITSYIRGSAQQMIWQSYYLMEETFRYETPEVIVFDVLSMKDGSPESTGSATQREAYNRMTLDGMRWSSSKIKSIQASMTEMEKENGGLLLYLFPLLRYHERLSELTGEDLEYWLKRDVVTDNGYLMQVEIRGLEDEHVEKPLVDYTFSDTSFEYLEKMAALCEEYGTQLVLIKAPSLSPVWWDEWDAQVAEFAREHDLVYLNLLDAQEEIGIDWSTDTYDTGLHLNVYGAEKLSSYFGRFLSEELGVTDHRSDEALSEKWAEKAEIYYARKEALEAERDRADSE